MLRRRGFTLIELLVVVSIIALLIAILLPSLSKAKVQAVRVKCGAVLRQWGTVVNTYATENSGEFAIKMNGQGWNSTGSGYATMWAARFNQTLRVCPGADQSLVVANTTVYSMIRYSPIVANKVSWKLATFRTPSQTVVMLDTDSGGSNPWISSMSDTQVLLPALTKALETRHRGVGGVAFLDGHVEQNKIVDYQANIFSTTPIPANEVNKTWAAVGS